MSNLIKETKKLLDESVNIHLKNLINEVGQEIYGTEKPIPLSNITPDLAKTAVQSGKKDNDEKDDVATADENASVAVGTLSPAQKEVIPDKALAFALGYLRDKKPDLDSMEAIVSSDNYIMDGHHRWAAATLVDPKKTVKVARINMPAGPLITALNVYTKGALGKMEGNPGKGDISKWKEGIKTAINNAVTVGMNMWPMVNAKPDEIKKIMGEVPGAEGDGEKGKELMLTNSQELKTEKFPNAPERIDMPVIDADKGELKKVCQDIAAGNIDLKKPYSKDVDTHLKSGQKQVAENIKVLKEHLNIDRWQKLAGLKK